MSTIVTRAGKGSALTHNEVDANFVNLNTDKYQSGDNASLGTITSSALTSGRVTFASTGGLLADSANLVWDNTNARLGIGTASPAYKLDVAGAINTSSNISFTGSGSVLQASQAAYTRIIGGTTANVDSTITLYGSTNANTNLITYDGGSHRWRSVSGTERMRIDSAGNVGIGLTAPVTNLNVDTYFASSNAKNGAIRVNQFGGSTNYGMSEYITAYGLYEGSTYTVSGNRNPIGTTASQITQAGGVIAFATNSGLTAGTSFTPTERMRIDSSGNLGLGVTPSAWYTGLGLKAIQNGSFSLVDQTDGYSFLQRNSYANSSNVQTYITSNYATRYLQGNGTHIWYTAPSGTAGNAITFTQAMTLDASGNLGLGVTPSAWGSSYKAIQFGAGSSLWGDNAAPTGTYISSNLYFNGTNRIYIGGTYKPAEYSLYNGIHTWSSAAAGTAGTTATLTSLMTLDASGDLLLNRTTTIDSSQFALNTASATGVQQGIVLNNPFGFGAGVGTAASALTFTRMTGATYVPVASVQGWNTDETSSNRGHLTFSTQTTVAAGLVERMRIDSDGNVGIGITPAYPFQVSRSNTTGGLEVANISLTGTQSADNYADLSFRLGNLNSRGAIVRAITNGGSAGNGHNLAFLTSANGATPTERMRITAVGEVLIGTTTVTSGGANLQVSDGITFPATAVASANANTLDDYEEGTWTPTIIGATTAGTGTYVTQVGTYTKVGRLVTITGTINWTAHTGTGGMRVSGLPFTSINTANAEYYGKTSFVNMTMPASTVPLMAMGSNIANINVQSQTVGSGASALLTMDTAASIYFSLTYQAA